MEQRLAIHFFDPDTRIRAEGARLAFSLGHHAEVYSDLDELAEHPPREGIIVARDTLGLETPAALMADLSKRGIWLPLVIASDEPRVERVVAAIKSGALDFFELPLDEERFGLVLKRIAEEAAAHAEARRKLIEARERIGRLSRRESEVLDWLVEGSSNKAIARALDISPRTVEIHRANMMEKLGANHAADAVRIWIEAQGEARRASA